MGNVVLYFMQIDALQEVLEKLRSKEMPLEKKLGWLPSVSQTNLTFHIQVGLIWASSGLQVGSGRAFKWVDVCPHIGITEWTEGM